jgi:hypothetical protein
MLTPASQAKKNEFSLRSGRQHTGDGAAARFAGSDLSFVI